MYTSNYIESALKLYTNKSMGVFPDIFLIAGKSCVSCSGVAE